MKLSYFIKTPLTGFDERRFMARFTETELEQLKNEVAAERLGR